MTAIGHRRAKTLARVIDGGYCVGCGACAATLKPAHAMRMNHHGMFESHEVGDADLAATRVCPFSDEARNEDVLARDRFPAELPHHPEIGMHAAVFTGYVSDEARRLRASSGGIVSWVAAQLLSQGLVDGVLHVGPSEEMRDGEPVRFAYRISRTVDEILDGASSKYYPVECSRVMAEVRATPGRYLFIGVPCFVKAARLLAAEDDILGSRLVFFLSLVCGHLKSSNFARFLAWQCAGSPDHTSQLNFRHKVPGQPANHYGVAARVPGTAGTEERVALQNSLFGTNWGYGLFRYKACDYCDDVVGETADLSVGDAWLPEYTPDWRGTSIVAVRSRVIQDLLADGIKDGDLCLRAVTADEMARSQAGGFRHRREGLAYRLARCDAAGAWRPPKRVAPDTRALSRRMRKRMDCRTALSDASHPAFVEALRAGDFNVFKDRLAPLIARYERLNRGSPARRCVRWGIRWLRRLRG